VRPRHAPSLLLAAGLAAGCAIDDNALTTGAGGPSSSSSSGGGAGGADPESFLRAPHSCAYDCPNASCAEQTTPYVCPALGAWSTIPHMAACPSWDGTYPAPAAGKCTATAPTGAALVQTGPIATSPGARVLPDGRAIYPAGAEWAFDETSQQGGETSAVTLVPGTSFVITVDTGDDDHAVRAVDTSLIGKGDPVTGFVKFVAPSYLNDGVAALASGRVYVSTGYGVVQALDLDLATGDLTENDAESLVLPTSTINGPLWYASGVAASPDGTRLVVGSVFETLVFVFDVDPTSATYMQALGQVDVGESEMFGAYFDPHDPTGSRAYVSIWGGYKVDEIDLTDPTMPRLSQQFATDKDPEGVAFLDARWMVVANDFGETLSLCDRTSGTVTPIPVDFDPGLRGLDVSGLAWDETGQILYATLAGVDALAAYDVDLTMTPPSVAPAGRLPTGWWPSGVVAHPDSSLTVINLRGHPIGPFPVDTGSEQGEDLMKGSVQHIPAPSAADLTTGDTVVATSVAVGAQAGYPTATCADDFPVPPTNTAGPSPSIKHVFFIVRENKTFDSLFGDIPGVDGDASIMMKATTEEMDQVWTNGRALARTFAVPDNFYSLAVKSTQGHHWTTYGRATDYCERTWSDALRPEPLCGIADVGRPEEGSLFEWLQSNNLVYTILGEIVGNPLTAPATFDPIDVDYPGGPIQNIPYNDIEKACYTAGRLRVACNLGSFTYMTLPNDHTLGVSPTNPTPDTMCSVNDEATGMFVDALSHSPLWASSLIVLTEDDPQSGADHVDYHRTPLVLISPWVKHAYVSKTHIDVASIHKIFAHVFGLPYPNLVVKNAGLPLDAFTSTPDYTPFTYTPHQIPLACGGTAASAAETMLTASWDFSQPDAQPGLGDQVRRWMRGQQLTELTPKLSAEVADRNARRARGEKPLADDDD
jgi:hypothetical protein